MRASYQPQLEAEVCALCHQDKNDPDEDGDFDEPNGVISEPTYLGHHVPTGVTIRNVILLVEAWRLEDGTPLTPTGTQHVHWLGGVGDPAQGYYAGLPGKLFAKLIYDGNGTRPTFFTDAAGIEFDNRIPALATDASSYRFAVPPGNSTLQVGARLIYRRSFRPLTDAKQWTQDGHGQPLADVTPPHFGHLMEMRELTVHAVDCTGQPIGTPCSDGNVCNGAEACDGLGACQAGSPLVCEDANPCTHDRCDALLGCQHNPDDTVGPCDDGSLCTSGDFCSGGTCIGATTLSCDDGNACTADSCSPESGSGSTPVSGPCEDGDACTMGDACAAGTCVPGPALACNDGNPCTVDTCVAPLGCVSRPEPRTDCASAPQSSVDVRLAADPTRLQLQWQWLRGALGIDDVGTPDVSSRHVLCVFDEDAGQSRLATSLAIEPGSAWENKGGKSWLYKDRTGTSAGVRVLQMKAGTAGRAQIKLKAKGEALPAPVPAAPLRVFDVDPVVTVQLVNQETDRCWVSTFQAEDTRMNRSDRYTSKAR